MPKMSPLDLKAMLASEKADALAAISADRLITEHYVRMNYEGEGRACLYQVITGGDRGEVLRKDGKECITPFDAIPFAATTPVPVTHRFFGRLIADLVMPVQREKTALKRGALDNLLTARAGVCRCAQYLDMTGEDTDRQGQA